VLTPPLEKIAAVNHYKLFQRHFIVMTVDRSSINDALMKFEVTFARNETKVLGVLSSQFEHIKLRYKISQAKKHFFFDNADPMEIASLAEAIELTYDQDAEEALKVGIFMLILEVSDLRSWNRLRRHIVLWDILCR
jgi:hypothetical protein